MARPVRYGEQTSLSWQKWASWTTPAEDPVGAGEKEAKRYGVTGWQPIPRPLTTSDVVALGAIITGAWRSARVSRAVNSTVDSTVDSDVHGDMHGSVSGGVDGDVVSGTARAVVTDERGVFAGERDDVRDCLLWVTLRTSLSSGFEAFWPLRDLLPEHLSGVLRLHDRPGQETETGDPCAEPRPAWVDR